MKKSTLLFLLSVIAQPTFGQSNPRTVEYFDEFWQTTPYKEKAHYYRAIDKQGSLFLVKDFYVASNSIQMEALCSSVNPLTQIGKVIWYHPNGLVEREGEYISGKAQGIHKRYYENGQIRSETLYNGENSLTLQYWSEEGKPLLEKGTGLVVSREENNETIYFEVEDSIMVASYTVSDSYDTLYGFTDVIPTYKGGMQEFYRGISKLIRYPNYARRNRIEGKVFIRFTINKKGLIDSAKVIKGIGGGCDEAALEACIKQTRWIPGTRKGKPVKTSLVLPIIFKLT
jgi:TonB family protein